MQRKYQLLVYGASGFTGRLCAKYLHENYPDLSWAIGGRNKKKLEQLKSEGYPAELAEINPEGIHRVAYGRYLTKKEAINMLYFIKYTLKEEAWYLEEK